MVSLFLLDSPSIRDRDIIIDRGGDISSLFQIRGPDTEEKVEKRQRGRAFFFLSSEPLFSPLFSLGGPGN